MGSQQLNGFSAALASLPAMHAAAYASSTTAAVATNSYLLAAAQQAQQQQAQAQAQAHQQAQAAAAASSGQTADAASANNSNPYGTASQGKAQQQQECTTAHHGNEMKTLAVSPIFCWFFAFALALLCITSTLFLARWMLGHQAHSASGPFRGDHWRIFIICGSYLYLSSFGCVLVLMLVQSSPMSAPMFTAQASFELLTLPPSPLLRTNCEPHCS